MCNVCVCVCLCVSVCVSVCLPVRPSARLSSSFKGPRLFGRGMAYVPPRSSLLQGPTWTNAAFRFPLREHRSLDAGVHVSTSTGLPPIPAKPTDERTEGRVDLDPLSSLPDWASSRPPELAEPLVSVMSAMSAGFGLLSDRLTSRELYLRLPVSRESVKQGSPEHCDLREDSLESSLFCIIMPLELIRGVNSGVGGRDPQILEWDRGDLRGVCG